MLLRSPVFNKRYLRTKAANPFLFSHLATFLPSPSRLNMRNAPPGQTIIATPLVMDGSGRYAVMVGLTTFCTIDPPPGKEEVFSWWSQFSDPGAFPSHSGIVSCAFPEEKIYIMKSVTRKRLQILLVNILRLNFPLRIHAQTAFLTFEH